MSEQFERFEVLLSEEIRKNQKANPGYYYNAKLISVKLMQSMGISDESIEKLLQLKIRPKDKK